MRAGKLRHRVEIQEQAAATPPSPSKGLWTTSYTLWADILPVQGREVERAKAIYERTSHKITIRYCPNITPASRVKYGDRIFNLGAVLNSEEKNKELVLYATEVG